MEYNFDEVIDRKNTNSIKYNFNKERNMPEDILPMWVADMDFKVLPAIIDKLKERVEHGIFGYSDTKDEYFLAIYNWFNNNFNWSIKEEWLVKTPGVVFAIAAAINAYTNEGEGVLIQEPVYYPFRSTIINNNRKLVNNTLILKDGHYEIDFKDFEDRIIKEKVKLFILCSPHNPVGRVWREWELRKLGEICKKHKVIVVSDEIHCDFVNEGHEHLIFTNIDKTFEEFTIVCTAPSKTFNIPALQVSNIFIANDDLRQRFKGAIERTGYSQLNGLGIVACEVAYNTGSKWLHELNDYIKSNLEYVRKYLEEHLPQIKLIEPEGTYLIWLDCRELNISDKEREELLINKGKLWISRGSSFGQGGVGFERMNIACPRETLVEGLERLKISFK